MLNRRQRQMCIRDSLGLEQGDLLAIAVHFQHALEAIVVGAVLLLDPGKDELVIGKVHPITRLHPQILLDAVVLGAGDTYDADCQPHMAKDHGPVAVAKLAHTDCKAVLMGRSRPGLLHAGDDDPGCLLYTSDAADDSALV